MTVTRSALTESRSNRAGVPGLLVELPLALRMAVDHEGHAHKYHRAPGADFDDEISVFGPIDRRRGTL